MKRAILMPVLAIATTMASVNAFADADAQYRAGADFARPGEPVRRRGRPVRYRGRVRAA